LRGDFNIVSVYLDNSWASEPQQSSVSVFCTFCISDLGKYSIFGLLFDLFRPFSMLFTILHIVFVY
jgi:hypothetical protein